MTEVTEADLVPNVNRVQFDFEEPRLDVNGFVVDYFAWRISESGYEWYEQPELPFGVQSEHKMMREVARIFERRHENELDLMCEQLVQDDNLCFTRYCEVVDNMFRFAKESDDGMSFGRLVGLIAFGGILAARLAEKNKRVEIGQISLYTSRFIDKRVRLTWARENQSWNGFMLMGSEVISRYNVGQQRKQAKNVNRWPLYLAAAGVTLVAAVFVTRTFWSRH